MDAEAQQTCQWHFCAFYDAYPHVCFYADQVVARSDTRDAKKMSKYPRQVILCPSNLSDEPKEAQMMNGSAIANTVHKNKCEVTSLWPKRVAILLRFIRISNNLTDSKLVRISTCLCVYNRHPPWLCSCLPSSLRLLERPSHGHSRGQGTKRCERHKRDEEGVCDHLILRVRSTVRNVGVVRVVTYDALFFFLSWLLGSAICGRQEETLNTRGCIVWCDWAREERHIHTCHTRHMCWVCEDGP